MTRLITDIRHRFYRNRTCSPTHNIIPRIQECIPETQQISFLWIPGHAGIPGNEKADDLAKEALNKPERLNVKYPVDDCKAILQHIQQLRQKTWDELGHQHSHNIKPHLAHCSSSQQNCRQKEVLLTRLKTGRTRLNAPWLGTQKLNICSYCNSNTEGAPAMVDTRCRPDKWASSSRNLFSCRVVISPNHIEVDVNSGNLQGYNVNVRKNCS